MKPYLADAYAFVAVDLADMVVEDEGHFLVDEVVVDLLEDLDEVFEIDECVEGVDGVILDEDEEQTDVLAEELLVGVVEVVVEEGVGLLVEHEHAVLDGFLQEEDEGAVLDEDLDVLQVGSVAELDERVHGLEHDLVVLHADPVLHVGDQVGHQVHEVERDEVVAALNKYLLSRFS